MTLARFRTLGTGLLFAMAACGGSVVPGDGGTDVPNVIDDRPGPGPDASTTGCPAESFSGTGACPVVGLQCSYGDDPNTQCRRVATCDPTGHWSVQDPEQCMTDAGRPACPASPPAAMTACTSSDQLCAFASGARCTCATCPPGGLPCTGTTLQWFCDAPLASPCPASVPNLGTACTTEGADCNYSACAATGWDVRCTSGVWVREQVACEG